MHIEIHETSLAGSNDGSLQLVATVFRDEEPRELVVYASPTATGRPENTSKWWHIRFSTDGCELPIKDSYTIDVVTKDVVKELAARRKAFPTDFQEMFKWRNQPSKYHPAKQDEYPPAVDLSHTMSELANYPQQSTVYEKWKDLMHWLPIFIETIKAVWR